MSEPVSQPPSEAQLAPPQHPSQPANKDKYDERLQKKKAAALQKLDKVRSSFDAQLSVLQQQAERDRASAQLVESNTAAVDAAIASINVEVARGTDWTELQRILKDERDKGNPIARMIVALDLHTNTVTLALSHSMAHVRPGWVDSGREDDRVTEVELDLGQSAYNNASGYYTQRKQQGAKVSKTAETSERALRAVERRTAQQLKDSDAKARMQQSRRAFWWEKYHWFVSSENFLVVAARDAAQSQLIAQRHLAPTDVYVCADVAGAMGVIVKNSSAAAVPPLSIQQAACMCLCRSSAWTGKPGSSGGEAWWVRGDEVDVAGEGGKVSVRAGVARRYVTRIPLVMGLAVLFRVSDECVAAHKGERRVKGGVVEEKSGGRQTEETAEDGKEETEEEEEEEEQQGEEKDGDGNDEKAELEEEEEDNVEQDEDSDRRAEDAKSRACGATAKSGAADVLTAAVKGLSLRGADVGAAARQLEATSDADGRSEEDSDAKAARAGRKGSAGKRPSAADKRKAKKTAEHSATGSANSVSADDDASSEDHSSSRAASRSQPAKGAKAAPKTLTRAQRAKQKKLAKYADQDEEDRVIAAQVLGLQTGKRRDSSNKQRVEQREKEEDDEEAEQTEQAEPETAQHAAAAPAVAETPSAAAALAKSVTAAKNPADMICRGCKEKGHAYRDCPTRPQRAAAKQQDDTAAAEEQQAGYPLELIDSLTGRPAEADKFLFALCVCAPYSALLDYKYRVMLLPGSMKRGKVVQAAVAAWTRAAGGREAERDMVRGMREDEAMGVLCANVKIAAGLSGGEKKKRKDGGG